MLWFTYDANGNPTWFAMPSGAWSARNDYRGTILKSTGAPVLGVPYDASRHTMSAAGTFRLSVRRRYGDVHVHPRRPRRQHSSQPHSFLTPFCHGRRLRAAFRFFALPAHNERVFIEREGLMNRFALLMALVHGGTSARFCGEGSFLRSRRPTRVAIGTSSYIQVLSPTVHDDNLVAEPGVHFIYDVDPIVRLFRRQRFVRGPDRCKWPWRFRRSLRVRRSTLSCTVVADGGWGSRIHSFFRSTSSRRLPRCTTPESAAVDSFTGVGFDVVFLMTESRASGESASGDGADRGGAERRERDASAESALSTQLGPDQHQAARERQAGPLRRHVHELGARCVSDGQPAQAPIG